MDEVDIYVTLLFTFGPTINGLIWVLWRIMTGFSVRWDPTRYPRGKPAGRLFAILSSMLLNAVFVFEIWYWTKASREHPGQQLDQCDRYGFFFHKVRLSDAWFRAGNACISCLLLLLTTIFLISASFPEKAASVLRVQNQQDQ